MFEEPKSKFRKYFLKGTKGVISILLSILLVPFTTLACSLLTAARLNSAVAIFDEALCNASNSTLGTYDTFLRKRFGLLAMSQNTSGKSNADGSEYTVNDLINETFQKYLEENLKTLSNTYVESEANASGVYSLADTDVLLAQVLEYSKYSVPTKLIADGLDLDDILEYLQKKFSSAFAITDLLTGIVGSFGDIITLCGDYKTMKNDVKNEETDKKDYEKAWNNFQAAANKYKSTYNEMNSKISEQQRIIDQESPKVEPLKNEKEDAKSRYDESLNEYYAYINIIQRLETLRDGRSYSDSTKDYLNGLYSTYGYTWTEEEFNNYCTDYDKYITELKSEKDSVYNTVVSRQRSYENAKKNYDSSNSAIEKAQDEINKIKNEYSKKLEEQKTDADSKKALYIQAISDLQGTLKTAFDSVDTVDRDVTGAADSISSSITTGMSSYLTLRKDSIESSIKQSKKGLDDAKSVNDSEKISQYTAELEKLQKQEDELNSSKTKNYAKAFASGMSSGLGTIKIGCQEINMDLYDANWQTLENEKTVLNNFTDYSKDFPSGCYEYYTQPLSTDKANGMWKEFLKQIFSGTLWGTIDAMKSVLKILFTFEGAIDSALNALVDKGYFPNGLPSENDTKSEVNTSDSEKSADWKNRLGAYSVIGDAAAGTGDLLNLLDEASGTFDSLTGTDKGSEDQDPDETKGFFQRIKDAITSFIDFIKNAITSVKSMLADIGGKLLNKMLVSGYFIYMTQNRITYSGKNLSNNSFNLRGQASSAQSQGAAVVWNSLAGFFGAADGMITSDAKCFYGAETEYLFGRSMNECENQAITTKFIYLLRMLFDLPSLLLSQDFIDLLSALAPTIIGAVVIVVLYILVEPLIDTLVLVNGGKIPFFKSSPFLTVSGFEDLMIAIQSCVNGKLNQASIKQQLQTEVNKMYSSSGSNKTVSTETGEGFTKTWNPFTITYTEQLLIMIMFFKSQDSIISSLSDIIQMEASEYQSHQKGNDKSFDLTKAFTYVRVEANFTTKEFIKLTDTGMFSPTERIMYRGY